MNPSDAFSRFNLYLDRGFLSEQTCGEIITDLSSAQQSFAPVYGKGDSASIDERVRNVLQLTAPPDVIARVEVWLMDVKKVVAEHFGVRLRTIEEPQFLRYNPGDFFVAHQDGNTGMLLSDRERSRKISLVIFLNGQSESLEPGKYLGGSLLFSDWHPARPPAQFTLQGKAGLLIAFPSETTHEVTPVIGGERYSIVSWYG
ncbi:MAG TPA: 2OG-Fe(II) oxygenase [Pyrinomonadaceae bacterium]|nr:2OG-Fe(II) oxygenase [Pyrinomonadaceae bacterium]